MRILQFLSNAGAPHDSLACFSNEFSLAMAEDGRPAEWLQIPYGDHYHAAGVIQRLTRPSAEVLVSNFKSIASSLGRLFGGSPIYIGHPDDPAFANQFSDRKSYGWVLDMEAREDGLYIRPKWGAAGMELLSNAHFKWFSPRWGCKPLPGVRANGLPVVEPVKWVSLGLTNDPNIQGIPPLANETQQPTEGASAMREQLIALLGLAPDATDEQIIAAASALKDATAAASTAVANEKTARATAETALSNERTERAAKEASLQSAIQAERKARIDLVLANAIAAGKITEAQKPQWAADLAASFDSKLVELSNAAPALPQGSQTGSLGNRNADAQANRDAQTRRDKILLLVNERMDKSGEDYTTAYAAVQHANAALFKDMKTPGKE